MLLCAMVEMVRSSLPCWPLPKGAAMTTQSVYFAGIVMQATYFQQAYDCEHKETLSLFNREKPLSCKDALDFLDDSQKYVSTYLEITKDCPSCTCEAVFELLTR